MKLKPEETKKLREACGAPLEVLLNDACELLTMKIVLVINGKSSKLESQMLALSVGSPERNNLAQQVNALNRLMVELSEMA